MSSVRLMVLGVLDSAGTIHGYKIYRQINEWRADTWTSIKPGSIYHALGSLEKRGMVDNAGIKVDRDGPSATTYVINTKGKSELRRLIKEALVSYDQEEFAAGLAWMHLLRRDEVISLVEQRLAHYEQTCIFMRNLPRDPHTSRPDMHPEIIDSWTVLFDATASWMKHFLWRLKNGQYHFSDE